MLNWISIAIKMHLPIGVAKLKVQIDAIFQDVAFMIIEQWWWWNWDGWRASDWQSLSGGLVWWSQASGGKLTWDLFLNIIQPILISCQKRTGGNYSGDKPSQPKSEPSQQIWQDKNILLKIEKRTKRQVLGLFLENSIFWNQISML